MKKWHRYFYETINPENGEEIADLEIKDGDKKETARNAVKRYVKKTGRPVLLIICSVKTEDTLGQELFEPGHIPQGEEVHTGEPVEWVGNEIFMNPATGSIGTYDAWWYPELDADGSYTGRMVNAVDRDEVEWVEWNKAGQCWCAVA